MITANKIKKAIQKELKHCKSANLSDLTVSVMTRLKTSPKNFYNHRRLIMEFVAKHPYTTASKPMLKKLGPFYENASKNLLKKMEKKLNTHPAFCITCGKFPVTGKHRCNNCSDDSPAPINWSK